MIRHVLDNVITNDEVKVILGKLPDDLIIPADKDLGKLSDGYFGRLWIWLNSPDFTVGIQMTGKVGLTASDFQNAFVVLRQKPRYFGPVALIVVCRVHLTRATRLTVGS